MTVKAVSMSRPVQAEEWAMRQASTIVEKHLPDMPHEQQWEIAADIAEALTRTRAIFDPKLILNHQEKQEKWMRPDPENAEEYNEYINALSMKLAESVGTDVLTCDLVNVYSTLLAIAIAHTYDTMEERKAMLQRCAEFMYEIVQRAPTTSDLPTLQ